MTNGTPFPTQAQRAQGLSFDAALDECRKRLGLSGAVGTVTFVLYADGSAAFKPAGEITPGLCRLIVDWGANGLVNAFEDAQQRALTSGIKSAVRN